MQLLARFLLCVWILAVFAASALAQSNVTVTVQQGSAAVKGAFVALVGTGSTTAASAGITSGTGKVTLSGVAAGTYIARAQASGTTVGTFGSSASPITVSSADVAVTVAVTSSGTVLSGLGAFGSQTGTIAADGATGVFYLNTSAIPSVYRTNDYGGTWAPVTISSDDPANGLDASSAASRLATSGTPGELAVLVGNKIWYSKDFGVTWTGMSIPGTQQGPGRNQLLWGHPRGSSISVLFRVVAGSPTMLFANMAAATPLLSVLGTSFKATGNDVVAIGNGDTAPVMAVVNASTGGVTLYALSAAADPTDVARKLGPLSGAIPTQSAPGTTALTASDVFWTQLGGPTTGLAIGTSGVRTPSTLLVYSDKSDDSAAGAKISVCGATVASCTQTASITFLNFSDAADSAASFGGNFGAKSTCAATREAGAIGSVSPLGSAGSIGGCWVTQSGSAMSVRRVIGINNNAGMAYDASYGSTIGGVTDRVVISGDGQHGAVKSARDTSATSDGAGAGGPFDPGLNRPFFPRFPVLASSGIAPASGGMAVDGINSAVVAQSVFDPSSDSHVATVMSFSGGGRTVGSTDGGVNWFTLYNSGGFTLDWWNGASGRQWIATGSSGDGNWLFASPFTTFSSAVSLAEVFNSVSSVPGCTVVGNGSPITACDFFGSATPTVHQAGITGIRGLPGTDYAIVSAYSGSSVQLSAAKLAVTSGTQPQTQATLTPIATIPYSGTGFPDIAAGQVRSTYCSSNTANVAALRDRLLAVLPARQQGGTTGGLYIISGLATAAGSSFNTGALTTTTRTDVTGDLRVVRADCARGTVWIARVTSAANQAITPGASGLLKSINGGATFSAVTVAGAAAGALADVVALDFNKTAPKQVIALSRNGDVALSNDDGATWTLINDTSTAGCQGVSGPCGRGFGSSSPGDFTMPPPAGGSSNAVASGVDATTPGVLGSGAGLFSVSTGSAASLSDARMSLDAPSNNASLAVGQSFTVAGWAVDLGVGAGAGVDSIHVYAFPFVGGAFGSPTFLGEATLGGARGDVGAVFGSQFSRAGYGLVAGSLPDGTYRVVAYAHSAVTGTFVTSQAADITVAAPVSTPAMSLDGPTEGETVRQPFVTGGWAIDRGAGNGTGVDAIHVWAFPIVSGVVGAGRFVDQATLNGGRSDVAAVFGAQFQNSGFNFLMTGLEPGTYIIGVYCRSGVTGTFNQVRFVTVTVR